MSMVHHLNSALRPFFYGFFHLQPVFSRIWKNGACHEMLKALPVKGFSFWHQCCFKGSIENIDLKN
jgi:hypothetical protein